MENKMRVVAIVQARLTSYRFPEKVIKIINIINISYKTIKKL